MGHTCLWPACETDVPPPRMVCRAHWKLLPGHLRARLWEVEQSPMTLAIQGVAQQIQAWIAAEFNATPDRHDRGRWERLVRWVRERDEARKLSRAMIAKEET